MEKKALGRGLDALLPATKPVSMPEVPDIQHLQIDAIVRPSQSTKRSSQARTVSVTAPRSPRRL